MPDMLTELSAEETALLDADRGNKEPVEPAEPVSPGVPVSDAQPALADAPAAGGDAKPTEPEQPQTVPYSALAEERNRRKEAEKQAREFREQFQRLSGRLDVLAPQQEQQTPGKPTVAEQPIEVLQELAQWKQEREQQDQLAQQWGQFNAAMQNARRTFEATAPDFNDAIKHLEERRISELQALRRTPEQIENIIQKETIEIASAAFQEGANPAEWFYALAQARGYTKADVSRETVENLQNGSQTNHGGAQALRGPDGKFAAAEKLASVARGQQAAGRSLSGAGGGSGGEITAEALSTMTQAEFDDWMANPANERAWKRVMGG